MSFDEAFEYTMDFEGGEKVTNDPSDPGGLTKWGISQRSFPGLNIRDLTEDQAKAIYKTHYWDSMSLDNLPQRVAIKLFDMGVNIGVRKSARLAQEAFNDYCGVPALTVDGSIGPKTISALSGADEDSYLFMLVHHLSEYYRGLNNPKYIRGWLRRAETLPK